METRSVAESFGYDVPYYNEHGRFQKKVAKRVAELCAQYCSAPARILDVGSGTGFLTAELLSCYPRSSLVGIDIAERMVSFSRDRFRSVERVEFVCGDFLTFGGPGVEQSELIASSLAMHWMQQSVALKRISSLLSPGGVAVLGLMDSDAMPELRDARRRVAPDKCPETTRGRDWLPDVSEIESACRDASLLVEHRESLTDSENFPTARAALRYLHHMGVTGGVFSDSRFLLSPREVFELCRVWDAAAENESTASLSYSAQLITVKKPRE